MKHFAVRFWNRITAKRTIMTNDDFNELVKIEIDYLGGGYFHPNMIKDGRVKDPLGLYNISGETMYDIDRINFGAINDVEGQQAWYKFWDIIDKSGAAKNWAWNYKGGALAPELISYVPAMIKPRFEEWKKMFLSPEAKTVVENDKKLSFQFFYAVYNGIGWFKYFANIINTAVKNGQKDPTIINDTFQQSRKGSPLQVIKQGASELDKIFALDYFS